MPSPVARPRLLQQHLLVATDSDWVSPEGSWASSSEARNKMLANRSRDTRPELVVRSLVHRKGLRFRTSHRPLPELRRTADLVFRRARVAVFVDGCFWHGCPEHYKRPRTNSNYWSEKIETNATRDRDTDERLVEQGWLSLRFWEHEDPESVADTVEAAVVGRSTASSRNPIRLKRSEYRAGSGT